MKKLIITIAALLVAHTPAFSDTIQGSVVDDRGQTVSEAQVVAAGSGSTLKVRTGADGGFLIDHPGSSQSVQVTVTKSGHTSVTVGAHTLTSLTNKVVLARQQIKVSGIVLDGTGAPISGVQIIAGTLGTKTTSSDGKFEFSIPYGEGYKLTAVKTGLYFLNNPIEAKYNTGNISRTFVGVSD